MTESRPALKTVPMGGHGTNNAGQRRADNNRDRALQLKRILARLIDRGCAPDFRGSITLAFSVKDGYIQTPHTSIDEWFDKPE